MSIWLGVLTGLSRWAGLHALAKGSLVAHDDETSNLTVCLLSTPHGAEVGRISRSTRVGLTSRLGPEHLEHLRQRQNIAGR